MSGCRVGRSGSGFAAVTCGGPGVALTRYPCTFPDCHGCSRRMIPYGSSVVVGDKGPGDWLPSLVVMPDGGGHRQDAPPIGPRSRPLPGGTQRWRVPAHSRPHDHPVCRRPARQGAGQAAPVQMERPAGRTIWTGAGWSAGLARVDGGRDDQPPATTGPLAVSIIPEPECPRRRHLAHTLSRGI